MEEDLIRLLFFAILMVFWIVSGIRKKNVSSQKQIKRHPETVVSQPPSLLENRKATAAADEQAPDAFAMENSPRVMERQPVESRPKKSLADELLAMIQEQAAPEPKVVEVVEPVMLEPKPEPTKPEVTPVRESHERFHELYVEEGQSSKPYALDAEDGAEAYSIQKVEKKPYQARKRARAKKGLSRRELKHAFVMREVLGPPKALE